MEASTAVNVSACASRFTRALARPQVGSRAGSAVSTEPIRGVWLLSVHHQSDLATADGHARVLDSLQARGWNTICPAVWNRGCTAWPSAVMERHGLPRQDPAYAQQGIDPLAVLSRLAQERGMRLIPWFEYGFAAEPIGLPNAILARYPQWAALDRQGRVVEDGGLRWLNGLNPSVQALMQELMLEVAERYAVDGLQGDDRIALPWSGSHDPDTLARYHRASGRRSAPADHDRAWTRFRCDGISDWVHRTGQRLHQLRPELIWSMAPTPLPTGRLRLMQDSARWLERGSVDWLVPQFYRNTLAGYRRVLGQNRRLWPARHGARVAAGVALVANQRALDGPTLDQMLARGRRQGLAGVVVFHYGQLMAADQAVWQALGHDAAVPRMA